MPACRPMKAQADGHEKKTLNRSRIAPSVVLAIREDNDMAWNAPTIREISCGMEINMYGPAEDDRDVWV
jgi:coenzyme PQQ precursor peptide PqqA